MPTPPVVNGLYWSDKTKTYHYIVKIRGVKYSGDTGHSRIGAARDFLTELKAAAAREKAGLAVARPSGEVTLDQAIDMWVAASKGRVSADHLKMRPYVLRRHFGDYLHLPLARLDTASLDAVQAEYLDGEHVSPGWKSARPRKPTSWNNVRRHIFALVNWAVDRELLAACPFKSKPIKGQKTMDATLWPEAVPAFLAAVERLALSQDKKTAVLLMISLGLRENEALGARWEGFDTRQGVYVPPNTKNREVREIALPPGLYDRLREAHGWEATRGLIMPGEGPSGAHIKGYTRSLVAKAGRAIGIEGLHPHCLRATFATAHWEAGTPLAQIMGMLGHADAPTTMRYIRQRPLDAAAAQAKVASAMGGFASGSAAVPPEKNVKRKMA